LPELLALAARASSGEAAVLVSEGQAVAAWGPAEAVASLAGRAALPEATWGAGAARAPVRCGEQPVAVLAVSGAQAAELVPAFAAQVAALLLAQRAVEAERADRLAMKRQLERADRLATVGRLAAGIAHELGTPLAVVAGRARQLSSGSVAGAQVAATARTIADQADRMTTIIRQLLDFARRREPRLGRFDIRTLLRQTAGLVEQVAQRREVQVVLADMPVARAVQFDGSQMMQVMTNLLVNAIQATPAGGRVTVAMCDEEVTPPVETGLEAGRYVKVSVTDTGSGIAPENLSRVFEPFFTTKDTGEGTGLGLSVAQGIVRDHEGWVAVESQVGQGSTFNVYLPG
jgi:signal transduction histidine kinase